MDEITRIKYKESTIISEKSDKPKADKSKHYISNPDLYNEFVMWHKKIEEAKLKGIPEPILPNKIGIAFIQIATNLAKKANWFSNTKIKEEMIGDAIECCVRYASNFNPAVTQNPFAYFTQTCYFAFLRRIRAEKKQDYVKHKSMLNSMTNMDMIASIEDEDITIEAMDYNQQGIEEFIKDFEIKNFGEELSLDEGAGLAGKRRQIKVEEVSSENLGFF